MKHSVGSLLCKSLFCKALLFTAFFAAGGFAAQRAEDDTIKAYVPILLNADATVRIEPATGVVGTGAQKRVKANEPDTLTLVLNYTGPVSVSHRARARTNAAASFRHIKGNVSLSLDPQAYRNAAVSLTSLNGRQVLRGRASAADGALNLSRQNIASGVYLLSVRGVNGSAFSTKLNHSGGQLNINIAFAGGGSIPGSLRKNANSAADNYGEWVVTITGAAGYADTSYTISPTAGDNEMQTVELSEAIIINGADEAWLYCGIISDDEEGDMEICFGYIFNSNGTLVLLAGSATHGYLPLAQGTYSIQGNGITLTIGNDTEIGTYSLSGNELILTLGGEEPVTLTRTALSFDGGEGGTLTLPAGYAWTDRHEYGEGNSDGVIFAEGNIFLSINDYESGDNSWTIDGVGTWSASDGKVTTDIDGEIMTLAYTVSNDTLTATFMGFPMVYTVTEVGNIEPPMAASFKSKARVNSAGNFSVKSGHKKLLPKKSALIKSLFKR